MNAELLSRIQRICVRQEKCLSDVRKKLQLWGATADEAVEIEHKLLADGFVDEARYANAFAREHARFQRWGNLKIKASLLAKRIPATFIEDATAQLDDTQSKTNLANLLCSKAKSIHANSPQDLHVKLVRFGMSRGYGYEEVLRCLNCDLND
jgi:regulatory protein